MRVNRLALLSSLSRVWPVVGNNQLVPEYQCFTFYGTRVQATDGALWLDSPLPEGLDLKLAVQAEPVYHLIQSIKDEEIELEVVGDELKKLVIKTGTIKSEFTFHDPKPASVPTDGMTKVEVPSIAEFVRGLDFCHYGAAKDESQGVMCGVYINGDVVWGCDRFRVLQWKMEKPVNLTASISTKMIEILSRVQGQIKDIMFRSNPGASSGGTLRVTLEGGAELWGCAHVGEYRDLSVFFPKTESAVKMEMSSDFPAVLDRHLTFLKDVPPVDKELVFTVTSEKVGTLSVSKTSSGAQPTRKLSEDTTVKNNTSPNTFEFRVNPSLLLDAMGKCWQFSYFPDAGIVLFEGTQFKYLVQTRS
jgi:hypothetical protein